ncbi:MAG: DUF1446 domain-containing protein [Defluviitaleaceae bacterium]|nr:DUF1446 domain-containing protein [Defluviitaleaceae bacterium]
MKEFKILSPTAILGYGFPMPSWEAGMKRNPDVIAVDAGSTDPGPYYLGAGISFTDREAVKRDLAIMIPAALDAGIPVIIGSAGGSGAAPHLQWNREIIEEIAKEQQLTFKLAVIPSDISKDAIKTSLQQGRIKPLKPAPPLQEEDIDAATHIVAQMGTEPIIEALEADAQVILTGRAYDPVTFAALAIHRGYDIGLATHLGKILECAAIAATPGSGSDCMFGYIGKDYFRVEPLSTQRKCTTLSVAAHTLYEKTNPYILPGPGGTLDLQQTTFTQETDSIVRVEGTRFIPSNPYTIKLEGAKKVGCRTVSFAATADPIMIAQIDEITPKVKARVADNFTGLGDYFLDFKMYGRSGKSGVMGIFETQGSAETSPSQELAIIIDAVAPTQDLANTICSFARSTLLHYGYPGRVSTAGNLAFPFSPSDTKMGDVYEFCIYHVMEVADPCQFFPIEIVDIKGGVQ